MNVKYANENIYKRMLHTGCSKQLVRFLHLKKMHIAGWHSLQIVHIAFKAILILVTVFLFLNCVFLFIFLLPNICRCANKESWKITKIDETLTDGQF